MPTAYLIFWVSSKHSAYCLPSFTSASYTYTYTYFTSAYVYVYVYLGLQVLTYTYTYTLVYKCLRIRIRIPTGKHAHSKRLPHTFLCDFLEAKYGVKSIFFCFLEGFFLM